MGWAVYGETTAGRSLDGTVQTLRQQNSTLAAQIAERQRQVDEARSQSWLEEEARRLGYVKPGERVFVLVTPGAPLPADGGVDPGAVPAVTPTPSPGATPAPTAPPGGASPSPTPFGLVVPGPTPH